jgi:hypothetical protein
MSLFEGRALTITLLSASIFLAGCAAAPILLGFGGAVAARAGETVAFPNVSSAILPAERTEIRSAVFEALRKLGVAKAVVQEKAGEIETIEASIDGRSVLVTLSPALDGKATRLSVRARSKWFQADEALQAALLAAIAERLKIATPAIRELLLPTSSKSKPANGKQN